MSTESVKKYETARARNMARARVVARLKASWVAGSELTPEQLAQVQPSLKQQFLEREARRAA